MFNKKTFTNIILLQLIMFIYSLSAVFSKVASSQKLISSKFIFWYSLVIICLFIYALVWQQILKHIQLTTAYANKATVTIWGILWGCLFFNEQITLLKLIGAFVIFVGVLMVVFDN